MVMEAVGIILVAAAIASFYFIYFKLTPWLVQLVPAGDWQGLVKVAIYILVSYAGGVALPIILFAGGVMVLIAKRRER